MFEHEELWLTSNDPDPLITLARSRESNRKLALLAAAISRQWEWLPDDCARVIEVVERFAEGEGLRAEVTITTSDMIRRSILGEPSERLSHAAAHALGVLGYSVDSDLNAVVQQARRVEGSRNLELNGPTGSLPGVAAIACLMREMFANPFRPVVFAPERRTDTAVTLARQLYESRNFSAMPILADALQDAGCDNDEVLNHCRGPGPHARGCWVVDLVLGKE